MAEPVPKTAKVDTPKEPEKTASAPAKAEPPAEAKPQEPAQVKPATPTANPDAKAPEQGAQAPLDVSAELKAIEQNYTKQSATFVLTIKVRKFGFFGVRAARIIILQEGKEIDARDTDNHGDAAFNLAPGDYTVQMGEKKVPITLKTHSTLKL